MFVFRSVELSGLLSLVFTDVEINGAADFRQKSNKSFFFYYFLSSFIIFYLLFIIFCVSSTPDEDHGSNALVFLIVLYVSVVV